MQISSMTPWGYMSENVPDIITPQDVEDTTCGRIKADDPRLASTIASVSAAIRDYCRWHVSPSLECEWVGDSHGDVIILPARIVTAVSSVIDNVTIAGEVSGDTVDASWYRWYPDGRVYISPRRCRHGIVGVTYTAGIDASSTSLVSIASQIAANALVATAGVQREQAGQVSITYNAVASGVSGGIALLERDRMLLEPYRLEALS